MKDKWSLESSKRAQMLEKYIAKIILFMGNETDSCTKEP